MSNKEKNYKDIPWYVWFYMLVEFNNSVSKLMNMTDKISTQLLKSDGDLNITGELLNLSMKLFKEELHTSILFTQSISVTITDEDKKFTANNMPKEWQDYLQGLANNYVSMQKEVQSMSLEDKKELMDKFGMKSLSDTTRN